MPAVAAHLRIQEALQGLLQPVHSLIGLLLVIGELVDSSVGPLLQTNKFLHHTERPVTNLYDGADYLG